MENTWYIVQIMSKKDHNYTASTIIQRVWGYNKNEYTMSKFTEQKLWLRL